MSEAPTTVATICQTLNARITAGEFAVDGKLPSERALSEQFATTRITLQEALGQLEAQGVIYRQVRRGWFISPPVLSTTRCSAAIFTPWRSSRGAPPIPRRSTAR